MKKRRINIGNSLIEQLRIHDLSLDALNNIIQQDREEYLLRKITPSR